MRKLIMMIVALGLVSAASAFAAKTYQVTGQVLEVNDNKLVVQKGKEKFEILRDKDTKLTGSPTVGSKVTVAYSMTAATIEAKEDKAAGKKQKK